MNSPAHGRTPPVKLSTETIIQRISPPTLPILTQKYLNPIYLRQHNTTRNRAAFGRSVACLTSFFIHFLYCQPSTIHLSFYLFLLLFVFFSISHINHVTQTKVNKERKWKTMKKLNDFGAKIGGAKKDLWALFNTLSDEEQGEMARKSKIWKLPNYRAMIEEGTPKEVCFWQNQMRKAVVSRPEANAKAYVRFVLAFKSDVEACNTIDEVKAFYAGNPDIVESKGVFEYLRKASENPNDKHWVYADSETKPFFDGSKVLRYVYSTKRISKDCAESDFLMRREDKEAKKYYVFEAKAENIETKPYNKKGVFANTVKSSTCITTFFDKVNYSELVEESPDDCLYIAMYDRTKIGVYTSCENAKKAIESKKEKNAGKKEAEKKEAFLPPHLSEIERTGSDYSYFRFTAGNVLMARYGLRGGEFGNYTSSKDRVGSINMAYDGFEDLYKALGISHRDISLGGELAIAFGARGRGSAMAHYEPDRNVINMTKKRGAGSLAHEWAHAMDAYLGKKLGLYGYMSENVKSDKVFASAKELLTAFEKQDGKETAFYAASKNFDGAYKKAGNGYWSSAPEMFARAFACYVRDKLGDRKSDYLVGHSEAASDGVSVAIPVGKEREVIDKKFDAFIADMIKLGYFSKEKSSTENPTECDDSPEIVDIIFYEDNGGQLMFC